MTSTETANPNLEKPARPIRYRPSVIGALLLVVVDGFLLLPGIGAILALLIVTGCWVTAVVRLFYRPAGVLPAFLKGLIYLAAILAIGGTMHFHKIIADHNGAKIVTAIEAYHRAHGTHPENLEELVPEYLEAIPRPSWRLMAGKFHYLNNEKVTTLTWYTLPPTVSETHDFRTGKQETFVRD